MCELEDEQGLADGRVGGTGMCGKPGLSFRTWYAEDQFIRPPQGKNQKDDRAVLHGQRLRTLAGRITSGSAGHAKKSSFERGKWQQG